MRVSIDPNGVRGSRFAAQGSVYLPVSATPALRRLRTAVLRKSVKQQVRNPGSLTGLGPAIEEVHELVPHQPRGRSNW
jgi:hypothetical protein